ncbi:MAG: hypothetical protein JXQ87_12805, partial [Bacteroidia bacterium]
SGTLGTHVITFTANTTSTRLRIYRDDATAQGNLTFYVNSVRLVELSDAPLAAYISANAANAYRYGFNGMEKDDELNGLGNSYTAEYWQYDSRLGRRWNLDPILQNVRSDYSVLGNNPIAFIDPNGDKFFVPKDDKQAKTDVKNLAKEKNRGFIKINDETGEVTLDFSSKKFKNESKRQKFIDKTLRQDVGLNLINDLSIAKDENGKDENYFYSTSYLQGVQYKVGKDGEWQVYYDDVSKYKGQTVDMRANETNPQGLPSFVIKSYSTYERGDESKYNSLYTKPIEGYDGSVYMVPGTPMKAVNNELGPSIINIKRESVLYHELKEVYLRTHMKQTYQSADYQSRQSESYYMYLNEHPGNVHLFKVD